MRNIRKPVVILMACGLCICCRNAFATTYNVSLDTTSLVGHPAGPFYLYLVLTDGNGVGDGNNTITMSSISFGGGSPLGSPVLFGGAAGSLEAGLSIVDNSFLSLFSQQFAPGLGLAFSLNLTSNDDLGGTPDRFTLFVLDSFGVPLPTLAPAGDYFLGVDLNSGGGTFDNWASDPARAPSVGNPVAIPTPAVNPVPEPDNLCIGTGLLAIALVLIRSRHTPTRPSRTRD